MRYTPAQLKELLEIPAETYRFWRRSLPPLTHKSGRGRQFTSGDILAVGIVKKTVSMGMAVSAIENHSDALFRACNAAPWGAFKGKYVIITKDNLMIENGSSHQWVVEHDVAIVVALDPIITKLQQKLLGEESSEIQTEIKLPPVAVITRR
jgi:DNA-binding transcriptional MerR regulator